MHPTLLKSQHLLPHQWINPFLPAKSACIAGRKRSSQNVHVRTIPPPSGKILSWLNLTQNPGWIGSFLKWGKSVPPISKKVPKKGADSQVVNLKRELSEQGDSIEDDKRAGQAVKVQTFYVVLVEFRDNTLGTNKIICKNMFFTMLNDVYFLVFWGISVHIWKLRICCWP